MSVFGRVKISEQYVFAISPDQCPEFFSVARAVDDIERDLSRSPARADGPAEGLPARHQTTRRQPTKRPLSPAPRVFKLQHGALNDLDVLTDELARMALARRDAKGDVISIPPQQHRAPADKKAWDQCTLPCWILKQEIQIAAQREAQEKLADLVPNAKHITDTNSGHEIHKEQPQLVIDAIRQVVDAVRGGRQLAR